MATYVVLFNMTDQGIKDIKGAPARVRERMQAAAGRGFKPVSWYLTMGQYDAVAVVEADDETAMAAGLLRLASEGNVRSTTMRAFSLDEFERITTAMS